MKLTSREIGGAICALLPFVVRIGDRSVVVVNGVQQVRWDYNYAGVVLGLLAVAICVSGLANLKEDVRAQDPRPHYAIYGAIILLGLYQAAKGAWLI